MRRARTAISSRPLPGIVLGSLLALGAAGCGEEVGRVQAEPGESVVSQLDLKGSKPAAFWTDLDVEFPEGIGMNYAVEVREGERSVAEVECDALDINTKMNSYVTNMNGRHTRRYLGKMNCDPVMLDHDASVEVSALFRVVGDPKNVVVRKADLVLRQ